MNKQEEAVLKARITQLTQVGQYQEAEKVCGYLVSKLPNDAQLHFALGQLLDRNGKHQLSAQVYFKAANLDKKLTEKALIEAAEVCKRNSLYEEGYMIARALIGLYPKVERYHEFGGHFSRGLYRDFSTSICYEQLIELDPKNHEYHFYLAEASNHLGENDRALKHYAEALKIKPDFKQAESAMLFAQNYNDELDDSQIYQGHCEYGDKIESQFKANETFSKAKSGSKIKVGYVSKDFKLHSVAYFFRPIVENFNAEEFEVYCYSDVESPDSITANLKKYASQWRDISDKTDKQVSELILKDEIDILVDLVGLTGKSRAGVYAMKSAPIQMTYLGYPNTYGMSRIDYRLIDDKSDPLGQSEAVTREELVRMPDSFLCYSNSEVAPDIEKSPVSISGEVTFGCFNVFPKVSPMVFELWLQVLKQVPNSKMVIKGRLFLEPPVAERILQRFKDAGIDPDRVTLLTLANETKDHLACYNKIDINLDTYPYNGTTTTCEALWQGVPTVTLAGNNHRSRVGVSILTAVGLKDWIAESPEDYVSLAVEKANAVSELAELRTCLRDRMKASPLMNGQEFSRNLEAIYKELVKKHQLREV